MCLRVWDQNRRSIQQASLYLADLIQLFGAIQQPASTHCSPRNPINTDTGQPYIKAERVDQLIGGVSLSGQRVNPPVGHWSLQIDRLTHTIFRHFGPRPTYESFQLNLSAHHFSLVSFTRLTSVPTVLSINI